MSSNLIILQARNGSTRLPGKVSAEINDKPMIEWILRRLQLVQEVPIVVATTIESNDDELVNTLHKLNFECFRGSTEDVYSRFSEVLRKHKPQYFIRITGDCPFVMPKLITEMIAYFEMNNCDYLSNTNPPTYPDGLDVEIVRTDSFIKLGERYLTHTEKEHVTLGLYKRPKEFRILNYENEVDLSGFRWTVDYQEDLDFARDAYKHFRGNELQFEVKDILNLIQNGILANNVISSEYRNVSLSED